MNNKILSKKILDLYSYVSLRNMTTEIFDILDYLETTSNIKVGFPKVTSNYQVRYEQFIPVHNSTVEKNVIQKLMSEENPKYRKELTSKITVSLRKLNDKELQIFNLTFYDKKSEEEIINIINYGKDKIREIRKSACIKFLSTLGLDKYCMKQGVNYDIFFYVPKLIKKEGMIL